MMNIKTYIQRLGTILLLAVIAGCNSSPTPNSISSHNPAAGAAIDCVNCHTSSIAPSLDPLVIDVGAGGSHSAHVNVYGFACIKCHYGYTNQPTHMDGVLDMSNPAVRIVYFDSTNPSGQWINVSGTRSCSNLYCHSIVQTASGGPLTLKTSDYKTPVWGDTATCSSCHGYPPGSGSHQKHAGSNSGQYAFPCGRCHSGYVPPQTTTNHVDGAINTAMDTGGNYNGDTTPANGFSNCSNTYCHSDGTSVVTGLIPVNASPTWGLAGPLGCNTCHGTAGSSGSFSWPATSDGSPSYPQLTNAGATPKANAHAYHMQYVNNTIWRCGGCHYATTIDGYTITNPANHANGQYDVAPAPGFTYNFSQVNFTYRPDPGGIGGFCDNVTCHGNIPNTAFWGKLLPYISGFQVTTGPGYQLSFNIPPANFINTTFPITYMWDFGDGGTESGTAASASLLSTSSHTYTSSRPFTVTFTGRDALKRLIYKQQAVYPQP